MEIYLNTGHLFTVPAAVADHFLKLASGDQLKVLLYVLCHADTALTAEQIALQCGVRPEAVEEALVFWQSVNILSEQPSSVPAVRQNAGTAEPAPVPATATTTPLSADSSTEKIVKTPESLCNPVKTSSTVWVINPSEMVAYIQADKAIADMFSYIEMNIGRPLKHLEQKCLLWMNQILGLKPDIIVMLAIYFANKYKFNIDLMEKTARRWVNEGITSHELAQKDIQLMEDSWSYTGRIKKIFGMDKNPTPDQQKIIGNWRSKHIQFELIRVAFEQTRNAIGDQIKLSTFKYVDAILERWIASGICTVEAAQKDCQQRESSRFFTNQIRRIIRLESTPTKKQQGFIDAWEKLDLPLDLIQFAYENTRETKGNKFSFEYLNAILQRWASAGIRTVEAAEKDHEAFQASRQKKESTNGDNSKAKPSRRTRISSIDTDDIKKIFGEY